MDTVPIFLDGLAPTMQTQLLAALGDLRLSVVPSVPPRGAEGPRPTLAVVTVGPDPEAAFSLVSQLSAAGTRVAVVAPSQDAALLLRALRAGAREFALSNDAQKLEVAVRNLARPVPGAAASLVTAVFAAKGGLGATTLAVNLAAALAASGDRTCVVDLDLQLGDVLSFLDLQGGYAISDVIANVRRLDRDLLDASVKRHRSGLAVLSQSERLEEAEHVSPASVASMLPFLRQHYGHVFVDGIRGFDELGLAALDACDRVLLVVTQEVPAVRNAQRCVEIFRRLGYPDAKLQLLVNRFHKGSSITCQVISETVSLPVTATIANDYAPLLRAMNRGGTIEEEAPRSQVARDLRAVAALVHGRPVQPRRTTLLERVFGGREARDGAR